MGDWVISLKLPVAFEIASLCKIVYFTYLDG